MIANAPLEVIEYINQTETNISVVAQETPADPAFFLIKIVESYSMNSKFTSVRNKISEISALESNWDRMNASSISTVVISNTYKFLEALESSGITEIDPEDVTPTPYGSIVIDLNSKKGLVSMEIGLEEVGFFTQFNNDDDFDSDGEKTDFRHIPENLQKALDNLYGI